MRPLRTRVPALLLVLALVMGLTSFTPATPAIAAACSGASCNNIDPEGRCSHDAKTVAAMHASDGMLELRWSPSCQANWGRFSIYERTERGYLSAGIVVHVRLTVWNPGAPSYGMAHRALKIGTSSWTYMTDGTKTACTGVELVHVYQNHSGGIDDYQSQGWIWGPCY